MKEVAVNLLSDFVQRCAVSEHVFGVYVCAWHWCIDKKI